MSDLCAHGQSLLIWIFFEDPQGELTRNVYDDDDDERQFHFLEVISVTPPKQLLGSRGDGLPKVGSNELTHILWYTITLLKGVTSITVAASGI